MTILGNSIFEWIIFIVAIIVASKYADYMAEKQMRGKIFITSAEPYAMEKIKRRYAMGHFGLAIAVEVIVAAFLYEAYKWAINNWQWIVGAIVGIIGIGLLLSSIGKQEENAEETDTESSVPKSNTKKYIGIGMVVIGAGLVISGMIGGSSKSAAPSEPTTQIAQDTQNINTNNHLYNQAPASNQSQTLNQQQNNTNNQQQNNANNQTNSKKGSVLKFGDVPIGASTSTVRNIMGNPTKQETKDSGAVYYYYPSMEIHFHNDKATTFISESPDASFGGIREGDPLSKVVEWLGDGYIKSQYGSLDLYEYHVTSGKGTNQRSYIFRFAVNQSDNRVNYISIRRDKAN